MTIRPTTFKPPRARTSSSKLAAVQAKPLTTKQRGYDAAWKRLRISHLLAEPNCRMCSYRGILRAAVDVDHIIRISQDRALRLDDDNLQSLCSTCHGQKTVAEQIADRRGVSVFTQVPIAKPSRAPKRRQSVPAAPRKKKS